METKLTLHFDQEVIEKAKEFALKMGLLPSLAATETRDTSSLAELGLAEDEQTRKILEAMRSLKE